MGRLLVFLGLIWAVTAGDINVVPTESVADPSAPPAIFPSNSELTYEMHLVVSTGVSTPAGHTSHYGIHGNLNIKTASVLDGVVFKVEQSGLTYTTYNGEATADFEPTCACNPLTPDGNTSSFNNPFTVNYKRGKIFTIILNKDEPAWARNIKRAIAQQFQVDLEQLKFETKPTIFTSKEASVWGDCSIDNTMSPAWDKEFFRLFKTVESSKCPNRKNMFDDNLNLKGDYHYIRYKSPVKRDTERWYTLYRPDQKTFQINLIRSKSMTTNQPSFEKGEIFYHFVNQSFQLLDIKANEDGVSPDSSSSSEEEIHEMMAELPTTRKSDPGARPDYSLGRSKTKPSWDYHKKLVLNMFDKMVAGVEGSPEVNTDLKKLHSLELNNLLWNLRYVDIDYMEMLSDELLDDEKTSARDVSMRNIYLSVLPRIGTTASVLEIKRLVVKGRVTEEQASDMLEEMPRNLIGGDAKLLSTCKDLLDVKVLLDEDGDESSIQSEATLAFASLVGKVCSAPGVCTPDVIQQYVKLFYQMLLDSDDYEEQVMYALALGNIGLAPVADYLEPLVRGSLSKDYSHRLQTIAASAAKSAFIARGPENVYSTFWPILADRNAHLELRVIAVSYLMESEPSSSRYLSIFSRLKKEHNPQLYNFFYTSVKALAATKNPFFKKMSHAARRIARYLPVPHSPRHAHTARYLVDLPFLSTEGEFSTVQITTVADPDTGLMDLAHFNYLTYNYGLTHSDFSLYLRVEGLPDLLNLAGTMGWGARDDDEEPEETERFKKLGVKPREQQWPHVELVMSTGGRASFSGVFNNTLMKYGRKVLESLIQKALSTSHTNDQEFELDNSRQATSINDLGMPIITDVAAPTFTSTRGDLVVSKEEISIKYDWRMRGEDGFMHRTLNPISGLWHGYAKYESTEIFIPISITGSLNKKRDSIKLSFDWKNDIPLFSTVMDMRSKTFVSGDKELAKETLKHSCPTCTEDWRDATIAPRHSETLFKTTVLDGEIELEAALFECEKPKSIDIWTTIISSLLQGNKDIDDEFDANCGVKITAMPVGEAKSLNLVFNLESPFTKPIEDIDSLTLGVVATFGDAKKDEPLNKLWGAAIIAEKSVNENNKMTSFGGKIRILRQAPRTPNEKKFVMCYKDEISFPEDEGMLTGVWDLLYNSSSLRPTGRTIAFSWGDVDKATDPCPTTQHQVVISGSSEAIERDLSSWPHSRCEADKGDGDVYPATAVCGLAADYAYGDRNFTVNMKHHNVIPEKFQSWFKIPESVSLDFTTRGPHVDSYTLTTPEGLRVDSPGDSSTSLILDHVVAMLTNHVSKGFIGAITRGLGSRCTLAGDRVLTFDNSSVSLSLPTSEEWTLLAADCRKYPSFTVYVRKVEGVSGLAVSAHILTDYLEITPVADEEKPFFNATSYVTGAEPTLSMAEEGNSYVWSTKQLPMFYVAYSTNAVTVRVPMELKGLLCGLCGDYDFTPEASCSFKGPDGEHVNLANLVSVYTLKP